MNLAERRDAEKDRKLRTLIDLANYSWKEFDGRRAQEWKANFALWAALAAITGFLFSQNIKVSVSLAVWISGFLLGVYLIYWLPWTTGMWRRNYLDTEEARAALDEACRIIRFERGERPKDVHPQRDWGDYFRVMRAWSRGSQLALTAAFVLLAGIALYYRVAWD
jgi:hypothetical protein